MAGPSIGEQSLTGSAHQRVDEQVQFIHQAVGEHRRARVPLPLT
jgi:hypothetical protein